MQFKFKYVAASCYVLGLEREKHPLTFNGYAIDWKNTGYFEIYGKSVSVGRSVRQRASCYHMNNVTIVRSLLILQRSGKFVRNKMYLEFHWLMKIRLNNFSQKAFHIIHIFHFILSFTQSL